MNAFKAALTTRGRKTGIEHTVWLRAVSYENKIYFSRRNENSDWLKNAIANPLVKVEFDGMAHVGSALLVTDEVLAKKISDLKYPGEERSQEARIVLQVNLN
ncbi:MAG: nitroreductase/quinone reductase family protein [Nitrososphaerota archaeon]